MRIVCARVVKGARAAWPAPLLASPLPPVRPPTHLHPPPPPPSGIIFRVERFEWPSALNMLLIAFGVLVCAIGEQNLVMKGLVQQLAALGFEVGG